MTPQIKAIREAAEGDLITFIKLVAPWRVLGHVHEEVLTWWERDEKKTHQLLLLPRDHMKSALVAYRCAWWITKHPDCRILYISSTAGLAQKQLKFIKDILTSKIYRRYWPEMVHPDEGKREKWTQFEIAIDHPLRQAEGIRDSTVFTAGLDTSVTGLHCDVAVLDDVVVYENAYTEEGRDKVATQYSLLSSIEGTDSQEWVVGTRYHPSDIYGSMTEMMTEVYDEDGTLISAEPVYEVFHRQVEDKGDGTGEYLWPRQQRSDGKWFGFNQQILAQKRAKYLDKTQFFAQYYNDPNRFENSLINQDCFQYYERGSAVQKMGRWFVRGRPISIFAACDLSYTTKKRSDYTAIVVIGVDFEGFIYVMDIDRFKTEKISEMFEHIRDAYVKWGFRKLRMEMTAAQSVVVRELKDVYIRPAGLAFSIDEFYPPTKEGSKEERMDAVLQPRYSSKTIWHYRGGGCQTLEDELKMRHPPHDDVKDAMAGAIEISVPPRDTGKVQLGSNVISHSRFGGVL